MSQLRLQQPVSSLRAAQLQLVQARTRRQPSARVALTVGVSLLIIIALQLLITIGTSAGVYEISALKKEKNNLVESTQILGSQVDSLSSPQNLSNAAAQLGMIANANPVFLNVQKQEISGKPAAALAGYRSRISQNLIANAELNTQTSPSDLSTLDASTTIVGQTKSENANVATEPAPASQVISTKSRIPASPTN
ncbi:MAG: hypothetical protein ACKOWE_01260 [Micrococcales bacterium]